MERMGGTSWGSRIASTVASLVLACASVCVGLFGLAHAAHATTDYNILGPSFVPTAQASTSALELGVKLSTNAATYVTQVKYYKAAASSAVHTAHVWDSTGTLLASETFTAETASGWQTVSLATPVLIAANTTFTVSVWSSDFYFHGDTFPTTTSGPLTVLNGVYEYGNASTYPAQVYTVISPIGSNYAIDLTVSATAPPAATSTTTPPTASPTTALPSSSPTSSLASSATTSEAATLASTGYSDFPMFLSAIAALAVIALGGVVVDQARRIPRIRRR